MPLTPLYGHDVLRDRFSAAVARGTLPASILLHGTRGVGKQRLALWLGRVLVCADPGSGPCEKCESCRFSRELTHPDLLWIFPRERPKNPDQSTEEVRIDFAEATAERARAADLYDPSGGDEGIFVATVRALVHMATMSPAMSRRKVIIVGEAERMVPQEGSEFAANAFLKLLEEPPANTTLILTSSEPAALLPTIRSRVVAVRVSPISDDEMRRFIDDPAVRAQLGIAPDRAGELVRMAAGAPGRLLAQTELDAARSRAERMLAAATGPSTSVRYQAAMAQGASGARAGFSDTLDALTALLHERVRVAAVDASERRALDATRAIEVVEEAKQRASGNVNPQLLTAALLRRLSPLLK